MADAEILSGLDFAPGEGGAGLSPAEIGRMGFIDTFEDLGLDLSPEGLEEEILSDIQARHAFELEDSSVVSAALTVLTEPDPLRPRKRLLDPTSPYQVCVYRIAAQRGNVPVEAFGIRFTSERNGVPEVFNVLVSRNGEPMQPFGGYHADIVEAQARELKARQRELHLSSDLTRVEKTTASKEE